MNLPDFQAILTTYPRRLPAALYLFRQGTVEHPCPVEVQHHRILRYIERLEQALHRSIDIALIETDLQHDRYRADDFTDSQRSPVGFRRLLEEIKTQPIPLVFLSRADRGTQKEQAIREIIEEQTTAIVINVDSDPGDLLRNQILSEYGAHAAHRIPYMAYTDFFTFYPQLAGDIIETFLADIREPAGTPDHARILRRRVEQLMRRSYHQARYRETFPDWIVQDLNRERVQIDHAAREARRQTDPLYRLGPKTTVLRDEPLPGLSSTFRSANDVSAISMRMMDIGFTHRVTDRVVSLIRTIGLWELYADPRTAGAVTIYSYQYRPPIVTRTGLQRHVPRRQGPTLSIPDAQLATTTDDVLIGLLSEPTAKSGMT